MKHLYYILIIGMIFPLSSTMSQHKVWKNKYAYRADKNVYSFQEYDSTRRSQHCKTILINQKREVKFWEV